MYPFGISTLILLLITDLCTLLRHCVIIVALSRTLKNHREGKGVGILCSNLSLEYWGVELGRGCCVGCLITYQGLDII